MRQYLIMCRSLTYAQRSKRVLEQHGILSSIVKAPQYISSGGCGYGLSIYRFFDQALLLLKNSGLLRGKVYVRDREGEFQEMLI